MQHAKYKTQRRSVRGLISVALEVATPADVDDDDVDIAILCKGFEEVNTLLRGAGVEDEENEIVEVEEGLTNIPETWEKNTAKRIRKDKAAKTVITMRFVLCC